MTDNTQAVEAAVRRLMRLAYLMAERDANATLLAGDPDMSSDAYDAANAQYHAAAQELEATLRAELTRPQEVAAVGDAARLDWLDAQNLRLKMGWRVCAAPMGNVSITSVIQLDGQKPTPIRDAIDAAILAKGQTS